MINIHSVVDNSPVVRKMMEDRFNAQIKKFLKENPFPPKSSKTNLENDKLRSIEYWRKSKRYIVGFPNEKRQELIVKAVRKTAHPFMRHLGYRSSQIGNYKIGESFGKLLGKSLLTFGAALAPVVGPAALAGTGLAKGIDKFGKSKGVSEIKKTFKTVKKGVDQAKSLTENQTSKNPYVSSNIDQKEAGITLPKLSTNDWLLPIIVIVILLLIFIMSKR